VYAGMVLAEPPPPVEDLEVRPVETFEEFAAARELGGLGHSDLLARGERERVDVRVEL
jgi:hypothetical protein